jgi:hypothetical protein
MTKNYFILVFILSILSLINLNAQITTFPYSEDFESGAAGWTVEGTTTSWALGLPASDVINSAASGNNAWATNLNGSYSDNENGWVQSPAFNLSSMASPTIQLKIWYEIEAEFDIATLQSSIDSGSTWVNVGNNNGPNHWFNNRLDINSLYNSGWTGRTDPEDGSNDRRTGSNGWLTAAADLSFLSGETNVIFRVALGSDGLYTDDGFAFDLVQIYDATSYKISSFPYSEDFEGGPAGWKVGSGSTNSSWELFKPYSNNLVSAASGSLAWVTNTTQNHNQNENSWVESPVFDLTSIDPNTDQFFIKFNIWYNTVNNNNDPNSAGAVLQSSIDTGATWQNLGGLETANTVNGYNSSNVLGEPGEQLLGWAGVSTNLLYDGWKTTIMDISQLGGEANVIFRVAFGSDSQDPSDGFAFDSIRIASNTCFAGDDSAFYETFTDPCSERTFSSDQEFAQWAFDAHNASNGLALDTGGVWSPSTFLGYGIYTYTLPANSNCPERSSVFLYNNAAPERDIIQVQTVATTKNLDDIVPLGRMAPGRRWKSRKTPVINDRDVDFPNTGAGDDSETKYTFVAIVEGDNCGIIQSITTYNVIIFGDEDPGENGVLNICDGDTFKTSDLFNALGGVPSNWGGWSPQREPVDGSPMGVYTTVREYTYNSYNVNGNNSSRSSIVTVVSNSCSLSNEDFEQQTALSLYPNPTKGIINIKGDISKLKSIEVYSIFGQRVMQINESFKEINISKLQSAIYFVTLNTEDAKLTFKVVKD